MDTSSEELATRTDHRTVAIRAADCAGRVLPSFEERYPGDSRPRAAIEAVRAWAQTGAGTMADIRKVALSAHAAAREAGEYTAAVLPLVLQARRLRPHMFPVCSHRCS